MPSPNQNEYVYSQEVDQIMGYVPPKIIRSGITIVFLVLFILALSSYFIRYPEIISTPIVLTTINSPAPLVSKTNGRIETWFVSDGDIVTPGTIIALLESTVNYTDLKRVRSILMDVSGDWRKDIDVLSLPKNVVLGSLQDSYLNFYNTFTKLQFYEKLNSVSREIYNHEQLIKLNKEQYQIALKQKKIREQRFKITKHFFSQDSALYEQNKFGIARREYDLSAQGLLQEQENLLTLDAALKNIETTIVNLQNEIIELKSVDFEKLNELIRITYENKQLLENKITSWSENHLLVSPIKGKITFTNFWSSNQVITSGQRLATVIPLDESYIVGRSYIPSSGLGKVGVGMLVNIKLSGFPFMRYGLLKGVIKKISLVPEEKGYIAEIELPNGMISDNNEELKFVQEMDGVAEIVTRDVRLINRLFNF